MDSPTTGRATTHDLKFTPVIGRTSSRDLLLRDYDSGVFSDEESEEYSEEDLTLTSSETSQADIGPHDKRKFLDQFFDDIMTELLQIQVEVFV